MHDGLQAEGLARERKHEGPEAKATMILLVYAG
jgi:hypothetical protein